MAKRKAPSTAFKPGQCGNLNGRPKLPPEIKEARAILKNIAEDLSVKYAQCTHELLTRGADYAVEIDQDKNNRTMMEVCLARIFLRVANKGDVKSMNIVLNRAIGPVQQKLDITTQDKSINNGLSSQEFDKIKSEFLEVLKAEKEWQSQTSSEPELPSSQP